MDFGLLPVGEVLEAIQGKPDGMNSFSTGARCPAGNHRGGGSRHRDARDTALLLEGVDARVGVER